MALALYRKYRPRTFAEVIGQEHVTDPLSQALRSGRLNHAYLFSGPRGCGKTSSARILARSLNCEQGPTPDPCGECLSCKSLANDGAGSIDVIEIDAASHGGVDDARDLREKAFFAPANSRYKIYVIDEAHMVSPAGFNALLKLVEEPPDYVKFIFATTEPDKVLGTIRSRTHHYPFRLIPPAVLRPYLQQLTDAEGVKVEPSVLPLVVRAGGGSARDSLSILDQLIAGSGPDGVTYAGAVALLGVTDSALIDEMCDAIATGQGAAAYATIDRVADAGHEPRRFASDLLERFRDLIILQQVPDAVAKGLIDGPADQLEAMARQAAALGAATLSRCADILHNGLIEMRGTTAPRLLLELVTARMLLPGADTSTAALLQRLERLEQGIVVRGERPAAGQNPVDGHAVGAQSAPVGSGDPDSGVVGVGGGFSADGATNVGGVSGGGKAAAMAAARAALNRPSGSPARPVSPAPAAPVSPATPVSPAAGAPVASAPADPVSPVSGAPISSVPDVVVPEAGPAESGSADTEPDWNQVAAGQQTQPAGGPQTPAGAGQRAQGSIDQQGQGGAGQQSVSAEAGYYDDGPPPWDEEPHPTDEVPAARPDDRLQRIRAAWQALGQHQSKVKAMQDYGIGVRELDGDMIVFAAPTQALMDRFLNWKDAIANEFRKSPGGEWRIRCEVGSSDAPRSEARSRPSGPGERRDQSVGHQASGASGRTAPAAAPERNTGRTESRPSRPQRAPAADADDDWPARAGTPTAESLGASSAGDSGRAEASRGDDWPEPAKPGNDWPEPVKPGSGMASAGSSEDDSAWPEPVRPGSGLGRDQAADSGETGGSAASPAPTAVITRDAPAGQGGSVSAPSAPSAGGAGSVSAAGGAGSVSAAASGSGRGAGGVGGGSAFGGAAVSAAPAASPGGGKPVPARSAAMEAARAAARMGLGAGSRTAEREAANSGAAAAGGAPPNARAAAKSTGGAVAQARAAAAAGGAPSTTWADGSPIGEAPYDPEYDGLPSTGAALEGFDPGDEPLDEVLDEKTARASSEEQAMQLLREAFGAEKIAEH